MDLFHFIRSCFNTSKHNAKKEIKMLTTENIVSLKAKDIMTKNVISVTRDTSIVQAIELISNNNITGVPIVDDDMSLVGILSEKDVLSLLYTPEDENKTVNDFMTQPPVFFDENESLLDVCECLINNYFRRIPVVSEGKLVGIITRSDIVREYIRQREQNNAGGN